MFTRVRASCVAALVSSWVLTVSGCGVLGGDDGNGDVRPSGDSTLETVSVKVALPQTIDTAPFYLAREKGYFRDEGLTVDFVKVGGGSAAADKLIGGEVDVAFSTYATLFFAESHHAGQNRGGIKLVADASSAGPGSAVVVAPPSSRVKSVKDLPGAKVAVTSVASITVLLINVTCRVNGVDYRRIKYVKTDLAQTPAALKEGRVDAAFVVEPFLQQAETDAGAQQVVDVAQGPTADFPTAGWASTGDFVTDHPHTIAAFQRAMQKATDLALNDREQVEQMAVTYVGVDEDDAKRAVLPDMKSRLDATRIQRVPDLLAEFHAIPTPIKAATMIVPGPTS